MEIRFDYDHLWRYLSRFSISHVVAYVLVGTIFLAILSELPSHQVVAIAFFEPFRPIDVSVIGWQLVRGSVIALILYPFYDIFITRKRGSVLLFAVVLGFSIIGSVEPMPGSIEGTLYTITTPLEHLLVIGASTLHVGLAITIFVHWERRSNSVVAVERKPLVSDNARDAVVGYLSRFTLLHVLTYFLAGILFMELQDYETAFETIAAFELYRPLDGMVGLFVFPTQIVRGILFGLLLLPLYNRIFEKSRGWVYIFGIFWGLTMFGAQNAIQSTFESIITSPVSEVLLGTVEITVQMALFSVLIWLWERRSNTLLQRDAIQRTSSNVE